MVVDLADHRRLVGEALNRHDFWRAGYASMLSEWRPEDVREFLLARPLMVENRTYAGADLAALLWNEKGFVTTSWNYDGVNALEPFMVERGYDPFHFIRRLLFRNNGSANIADCRSPESVLGEGNFNRDEQGLHLDGRLVARQESFFDFAARWKLDIKGYKVPDREVLVAGEDVFCPRRNRVVIYRDCAYQAPAYISRVRHKKIANKDRRLIQHLVTDSLLEEDLFSPEIRRRHLEMIKSLEKRLVFEYWDRDESITVNGEHLTKGVPAKILRHVLLAVREGRSEFEYRGLKRNFEITLGQKNSNFEVRFYRLVDKLKAESQGVRIEKTGRGRFRLSVDGEFGYSESG